MVYKVQTSHLFLNWADIECCCSDIREKMREDDYEPECIIGLLRGGVIPARIFSDYYDILLDFFALDVKLYTGINERNDEPHIKEFFGDINGKRALVVDDIWDSGKTMEAVLEKFKGHNIKTATLFWKETAPSRPNFYAKIAKENQWVVFPWENNEFQREMKK